jgi:hypothetical protein
MFSLTYMLSELRRRRGRTVLTALGLALGVGLVVTVNALSNGLDRAQDASTPPSPQRRLNERFAVLSGRSQRPAVSCEYLPGGTECT